MTITAGLDRVLADGGVLKLGTVSLTLDTQSDTYVLCSELDGGGIAKFTKGVTMTIAASLEKILADGGVLKLGIVSLTLDAENDTYVLRSEVMDDEISNPDLGAALDTLSLTKAFVEEQSIVHRYYFLNRPPSIGTHPTENETGRKVWMPRKEIPGLQRTALGWTEQSEKIPFYDIWRFELLPHALGERVKYEQWRQDNSR